MEISLYVSQPFFGFTFLICTSQLMNPSCNSFKVRLYASKLTSGVIFYNSSSSNFYDNNTTTFHRKEHLCLCYTIILKKTTIVIAKSTEGEFDIINDKSKKSILKKLPNCLAILRLLASAVLRFIS
jgi:hypothetical protein